MEGLIFTGGLNHCSIAACLGLFSDIDSSAYCSIRQSTSHSLNGKRPTVHRDLICCIILCFTQELPVLNKDVNTVEEPVFTL